ncbi:peptidoglycan editing factor PgeF [Thiocystis violascens]|uniref:Purine nucleoside phosphorylase n=1 Tax=Thiocystis violascens (strain ATCC 17096 / DSM 198 / 6111) TaxID=765911 RepID=I3YE16_THIV6|nr:peptidoglycan editing factor PgeF [Thiocystis violascens]AFL75234.1 uncharacterized protein, YfiH family [Thiocystis violascens DSM 198]
MELIRPEWPAPPWVRTISTTRDGGRSEGPFASLNLGDHVGDEPARVDENRARLLAQLGLSTEPYWLRQVHGRAIVRAGAASLNRDADGAVADTPGAACVVMTADCLPLLLCDAQGTRVAAVHAGWRGLAGGVVEAAVAALDIAPERLLVWLGPAIGPAAFAVGDEVRERFVAADARAAAAFRPGPRTGAGESPGSPWFADLFLLARQRLDRLGIERVYGGGDCTFSQPRRFFSYRRDGVTGRMASLIWLAPRDEDSARAQGANQA